MKHWLRLHWLSLIDSIKYLVTSPLAAGLNIIVIGIAISLPLGLFILLSSGKKLIDTLPKESQLTVFMYVDATEQERRNLARFIKNQTHVETVHFIHKEEGLKELTEHSGLQDLLAGLPNNPLPHAFTVTVKNPTPEKLSLLQKKIGEEAGVESVLVDTDWAKRLLALAAIGDKLLTVLIVALGTGLIFITGNTIRLQILTRLEEIEVGKLVGATDAFIRRPFIYFGLLQGISGSLLAYGLVWLMLYYINPSIHTLATLYNTHFNLVDLPIQGLLITCTLTSLLCLVGTSFSVWKHLRQFT